MARKGIDRSDLDGFTEDMDCNDNDARINPNAEEVCDQIDNDCDGEIDGASATGQTTWYADVDGDSFGDAANTMDACVVPDGYVEDNTDCDDANSDLRPDDEWGWLLYLCGDCDDDDCIDTG